MALRFELLHHPRSSEEYHASLRFFREIDEGLAALFQEDFAAVLRALASGDAVSTPYASQSPVRWVKLRRFSHKVFFEPQNDGRLLILGIISGKRHPAVILQALTDRR